MAKVHWQQYPEDTKPFCARVGQVFKHTPKMVKSPSGPVTCKICAGEIAYRRKVGEALKPRNKEAERARTSYSAL